MVFYITQLSPKSKEWQHLSEAFASFEAEIQNVRWRLASHGFNPIFAIQIIVHGQQSWLPIICLQGCVWSDHVL